MEWLGEQYGNIASVVGLVLSLLTLIVAARIRARIEEVKRQLLQRVDSVDALNAAGRAELSLQECLDYCATKNWVLAIDRCKLTLRFLNVLKDSDALSGPDALTGRRGIDDIKTLLLALEAKSSRGGAFNWKQRNVW